LLDGACWQGGEFTFWFAEGLGEGVVGMKGKNAYEWKEWMVQPNFPM
jgi:hypothetical protein